MTIAEQLEKIQAQVDSTANKTRSQYARIVGYQREVINELLRQIQESNVEDSIAQCRPLTPWKYDPSKKGMRRCLRTGKIFHV